jgi:CheY-like chemotaxis protein
MAVPVLNPPKSILWVDDEGELLEPHRIFLRSKGYTVEWASNADDAIELLRRRPFDILLLDEQMPGKRGLEVYRDVREIAPTLPVVMVTKSEEDSTLKEAICVNIRDYLVTGYYSLSGILFANAQGYIHRGDVRLGVFDAGSALDVAVETLALDYLVARGDDRSAAEARCDGWTVFRLMKEVIIPAFPSFDADGSRERWLAWNDHPDGKKLRNRVVHDGYIPTREEAASHYDRVGALLHTILNLKIAKRPRPARD